MSGGLLKRLLGNGPATAIASHRLAPRLVVLCWHDIAGPDGIRSWMRVRQDDFAEQIDGLFAYGRFISVHDLDDPDLFDSGGLKYLVTFDDGYVNNLRLALPVLESRGVPALFFVSGEHVESGRPFWFDRVVLPIQALRLADLDLRDAGLRRYRFRPSGAGRWDDIQTLLTELKGVGNESDPTVASVLETCDSLLPDDKAALRDSLRPMTPAELSELAARPFMRIGSHSHRHEILTKLTDAELADNLERSRRMLAEMTGREIHHLAYPNGDHDARVRAAAVAAGYRTGFATAPGAIDGDTDRFALPRILVGGYDDLATLRFKINRLLMKANR